MYKLNRVIRHVGRMTVLMLAAVLVLLFTTADLIDLELLEDRKVLMLVGAAIALAWLIAGGFMAIIYLYLRDARSELSGQIGRHVDPNRSYEEPKTRDFDDQTDYPPGNH